MGKSWKDGKHRDKWEKFGKKKTSKKPKRFEEGVDRTNARAWTDYDGDGDYRTNKPNSW